MNKVVEWVKDGDNLLPWIPVQHRKAISNSRLRLVIGRTERRRGPEVDIAGLYAYSGSRWTDLYHANSEMWLSLLLVLRTAMIILHSPFYDTHRGL